MPTHTVPSFRCKTVQSRFTDTFVKSAPSGYHWEPSGLGLRVGKTTRTFLTILGSGNRHTIGRYPIISLADARRAALEFQAARTLRTYSPSAIIFNDALTRFLEAKKAKNRLATVNNYRLRLHQHWVPMFGSRKLTEISRQDVLSHTHPSDTERHYALVVLKVFFSWCVQHGLTTNDPTYRMPSVTRYKPRERVLTPEELTIIIQEVQGSPDPFYRSVFLLILTGCRRNEIQYLVVNGDTATLPAKHSKNGREHTFPLPAMAVALFDKPLAFNGWSKAKARLDKKLSIDPWTLHDLRRTYATIHARLNVQIHVVEKLLNHASGSISGVAAIYNRYQYADEMRDAVNKYEAWLMSVVVK